MSDTVNLGHIDLSRASVQECVDCLSRNIKTIPREVSPDEIQKFVRARAGRLGLNLADYDIKVDKGTGAVTATLKPQANLEIEFS